MAASAKVAVVISAARTRDMMLPAGFEMASGAEAFRADPSGENKRERARTQRESRIYLDEDR
jgi:hypothetical protein